MNLYQITVKPKKRFMKLLRTHGKPIRKNDLIFKYLVKSKNIKTAVNTAKKKHILGGSKESDWIFKARRVIT